MCYVCLVYIGLLRILLLFQNLLKVFCNSEMLWGLVNKLTQRDSWLSGSYWRPFCLARRVGWVPADLGLISGIILAFLNLRVSTIFISVLVLCFVAVVVIQRKWWLRTLVMASVKGQQASWAYLLHPALPRCHYPAPSELSLTQTNSCTEWTAVWLAVLIYLLNWAGFE